jgi:hypothetical protein
VEQQHEPVNAIKVVVDKQQSGVMGWKQRQKLPFCRACDFGPLKH